MNRQGKISEEVYKTLLESVDQLKDAYKLLTNKENIDSQFPSKLISLGIALVAIPAPVVTESIGLGLIGTGLLLKKIKKGEEIQLINLDRELAKEINEIKSFINEIKSKSSTFY